MLKRLVALAVVAPAALAQPTIDFPVSNLVYPVLASASDDAATILVRELVDNGASYIWDEVNGLRAIPELEGFEGIRGYGISDDGRYVSVQHIRAFPSPNRQQSRFDVLSWNHELIGFGPTNNSVEGFGISPDGGTIPLSQVSVAGPTLARWRPGESQVPLHTLPAGTLLTPRDANLGGTVIVGDFNVSTSLRAFRFANGFQELMPINPNEPVRVRAVSHDGSAVLGRSGVSAAVWIDGAPSHVATFSEGFTTLGTTLNAGATVAGGNFTLDQNGFESRAWIWSSETGPIIFQDYLTSLGLTVPDLATVDSISADGTRFVGLTSDDRVYRVTLQTPIAALMIPSPSASIGLLAGLSLLSRQRRSTRLSQQA